MLAGRHSPPTCQNARGRPHEAHLGSQRRELETSPDDGLERVDGEGTAFPLDPDGERHQPEEGRDAERQRQIPPELSVRLSATATRTAGPVVGAWAIARREKTAT